MTTTRRQTKMPKINFQSLIRSMSLYQKIAVIVLVLSMIFFSTGWLKFQDNIMGTSINYKEITADAIDELRDTKKNELRYLQDEFDDEGYNYSARRFVNQALYLVKSLSDGALSIGEIGKDARILNKWMNSDLGEDILDEFNMDDIGSMFSSTSGSLGLVGFIYGLLWWGTVLTGLASIYLFINRKTKYSKIVPWVYCGFYALGFLLMFIVNFRINSAIADMISSFGGYAGISLKLTSVSFTAWLGMILTVGVGVLNYLVTKERPAAAMPRMRQNVYGRTNQNVNVRRSAPVNQAPIVNMKKNVPSAKFCPRCGAPLKANQKFCSKCGAPINQ